MTKRISLADIARQTESFYKANPGEGMLSFEVSMDRKGFPLGDPRETLGFSLHGELARVVHHIWIDTAPDRPSVRCSVTLRVKPVDQGGNETIKVTSQLSLHYEEAKSYTTAAWRAWVFYAIKSAWLHELDEGVKIDGRHVNDPHPNELDRILRDSPMMIKIPKERTT